MNRNVPREPGSSSESTPATQRGGQFQLARLDLDARMYLQGRLGVLPIPGAGLLPDARLKIYPVAAPGFVFRPYRALAAHVSEFLNL